jgi:hypothetical protein
MLAINCALLTIPVNPLQLLSASPDELLWLEVVVDDVNYRHEREHARART